MMNRETRLQILKKLVQMIRSGDFRLKTFNPFEENHDRYKPPYENGGFNYGYITPAEVEIHEDNK